MIRRILSALMAAALTCSLAACGDDLHVTSFTQEEIDSATKRKTREESSLSNANPEPTPQPTAAQPVSHPLLDGKTEQDILAELEAETHPYTRYNAFQVPEHQSGLELFEEWVAAFEQGEPAQLFLLLDALGFPNSARLLETTGDATYTVYRYDMESEAWISGTSSIILRRAHDYVLMSDAPVRDWYNNWQALVIGHTPITWEEYGVSDLAAGGSLGQLTQEQARETLQKRILQFRTYADQGNAYSFYAGGQYFPLDLEPAVSPESDRWQAGEELQLELRGAVRVSGQPCYLFSLLENGQDRDDLYVISADGDLFYTVSMVDGNYIFYADGEPQIITAP